MTRAVGRSIRSCLPSDRVRSRLQTGKMTSSIGDRRERICSEPLLPRPYIASLIDLLNLRVEACSVWDCPVRVHARTRDSRAEKLVCCKDCATREVWAKKDAKLSGLEGGKCVRTSGELVRYVQQCAR